MSASQSTRVQSFSIDSTYKPLKYVGDIPDPVSFATIPSRRGRRPNQPEPARRPPPTESMEGVAKTLRDAIEHAAHAANILVVDERVLRAPLLIDLGGLLWNVRKLYLFELPFLRELRIPIQGPTLRRIAATDGTVPCCLPAMITQLLNAVISSPELRAQVEGRTVVAPGWNDLQDFPAYPALSFTGTPRVTVVNDPLSAEYVFAFARS